MSMPAQSLPRLDPRLIYAADAVISLGMGVLLMLFATPLTALAGWSLPPEFLFTIGMLLVPWAAFNAWIARSTVPAGNMVRGNLAGDAFWVIASLGLILVQAPNLSAMGLALLLAQAAAVAMVFLMKRAGLAAMTR